MSKTCPKCGSIRIVETPSGDVSICLACESLLNTIDGKSKQTLFNRITVSPEVLADEFVYCAEPERFCECADWRSVILGNVSFATRYEAFAATLAKLKEVEK